MGRTIQLEQRFSRSERQEALALACGQPRIARSGFRRVVSLPRLWVSWTYWRICEVLSEARSFLGHISVRRKTYGFVPIGLPGEPHPSRCRPGDSRSLARTIGIREMLSSRVWASPVDLQIFLEGWDKGEMWASRKHNQGQEFCSLQLGTKSLAS